MIKHRGYFSDPEDIKKLIGLCDREIVAYMVDGRGAFHSIPEATPPRGRGTRRVDYKWGSYYVKRSVNLHNLDGCDNRIYVYVK